jgi:hypothetical protein
MMHWREWGRHLHAMIFFIVVHNVCNSRMLCLFLSALDLELDVGNVVGTKEGWLNYNSIQVYM